MNKRIEELAEQAGAKFPFGGFVNYDQFDCEKFAELIVRECAEVVTTLTGIDYVGTAITKRFGVK